MNPIRVDSDGLAEGIRKAQPGDQPIHTTLHTSDRVIRRVTDGIYREPWAALRELISNAYDADATRVVISTDAPRFQRITVRDNGNGFTAESLASMCLNIGGSPKRTAIGAKLGVTSDEDADKSPGGRRLIGKLGIGLFAVSQLTQQFRIITKRKGAKERTVADVTLFRNSEKQTKARKKKPADEPETAGEVSITKLPAEDIEAQGTDILIDTLLPRTRDEFRSRDVWELIRSAVDSNAEESAQRPAFHIGYPDPRNSDLYVEKPSIPWEDADPPEVRFRKLADAMFDRVSKDRKPSLVTTFDNYFRFLWYLSLSAPLDYLGGHPFDLDRNSGIRVFRLGELKTGKATEVELRDNETVRSRLKLTAPERGGQKNFAVLVDGLELRRPIRFTGLPSTKNKLRTPILFVGADEPDMSKYDERKTGGALRFEGYLLWCPRVVPVEHNGVLVRVNDSSGSLFDSTFMKYQVSEQTRRDQVTAEVFVHEGMDAALHIDRESFNHSHPHFQYIATWLHDSFKQFATKHKSLGAEARATEQATSRKTTSKKLVALAEDLVQGWDDTEQAPVEVRFSESPQKHQGKGAAAVLDFQLNEVFAGYPGDRKAGKKNPKFESDQERVRAVAQVLYAAGALDNLTRAKQEQLLQDLVKIMFFEVEE